LQTQCFNYEKM